MVLEGVSDDEGQGRGNVTIVGGEAHAVCDANHTMSSTDLLASSWLRKWMRNDKKPD